MNTTKINVLTSLRFFASSTVVVGHSLPFFGLSETLLRYIPAYNGVTFFFVLSGFILTFNYRTLETPERVWRFAVARFARLWPLHFTTFVLAIILLPDLRGVLFTPVGMAKAALNLTFMQSFVPFLGFQFSYNSVSWSISDEFYFYACFVGLLSFIGRPFSRLTWIALAGPIVMVSICIALALPSYDPNPLAASGATLIYIHPVARLLDFGIGMVAAALFLQFGPALKVAPRRLATLLEAVVILLIIGTAALTYSSFARVWPSAPPAILLWLERSGSSPIYALGIFILAFERGRVSRLLRHPGLVLLGEISFATYLAHQIILRWLAAHPAAFADVPLPAAYGLFLAAVLSGSWILWRFIERPARTAIYQRLAVGPARSIALEGT